MRKFLATVVAECIRGLFADGAVRVGSHRRRCGLSRTDGPHWLVGNHDRSGTLPADAAECSRALPAQDFVGQLGFRAPPALRPRKQWNELCFQRCVSFLFTVSSVSLKY